MLGRQVTIATGAAQVLVDGSAGTAEAPMVAQIRPITNAIFLGGPDADATHGFTVLAADAPLTVWLVGEKLYAAAASSTVVHVLKSRV